MDHGFTVLPVKADPYLNQDAGTMNPFQHGEVFVTEDGAETDLDLGHYERFLDINLTRQSNFTSGAVYQTVMEQEREGEFLGNTIQIIPHVTDEIKRRIRTAKKEHRPDFLLVEIGGTVGDIEALPFIEAIRQYALEEDEPTVFVHVVKMDYLYPSDEGKTKPIQHSVHTLRSYGLQPNLMVVRCKRPLTAEERNKIAMFTGVPLQNIIPALDAKSLYDVPNSLDSYGIVEALTKTTGHVLAQKEPTWDTLYTNLSERDGELRIGLVGKYLEQGDAYLSVIESVEHACTYHKVKGKVVPINADGTNLEKQLDQVDAVIVPGGFGIRGVEGKIATAKYARERGIPYLGICLGLQIAVIEFARDVAGLTDAHSEEFDDTTPTKVVAFLPDQVGLTRKGGTMRLGSYPAKLKPDTLAYELYAKYRPEEVDNGTVTERHRHRYEVNPKHHAALEQAGLVQSGSSPDGLLTEFIELPRETHPYFIATQAHPEFRSRPQRPHPLFAGLVEAALRRS